MLLGQLDDERRRSLFYALVVASIVFWVTFQPGLLPAKDALIISSAVIAFVIGVAFAAYTGMHTRYSDLKMRLVLLDTYRRKSSLPDRLDLAQVIGTEEIPLRIVIDNLLAEEKGLPKVSLEPPLGFGMRITTITFGLAFIASGLIFLMVTLWIWPTYYGAPLTPEILNVALLMGGSMLGVGGFMITWFVWLTLSGKHKRKGFA
jgi:hypothetical protein